MSFQVSESVRDIRATIMRDAISGGKIVVMTAASEVLVECPISDLSGVSVSAGSFAISDLLVPSSEAALAGDAAKADICDSSGNPVLINVPVTMDGGAGPITLSNLSIQLGSSVDFTSFSWGEYNGS